MSKLDTQHPLRSMLEHAGITTPAQMAEYAERFGCTRANISQALGVGDGIRLVTLKKHAKALGVRLVLCDRRASDATDVNGDVSGSDENLAAKRDL